MIHDYKSFLMRVVVPVGVALLVMISIIMHRGTINAEIPFDYPDDPYPMSVCPRN